MSIRVAFDRFADETKIIGRLLAHYTDLELNLMHCVQVVRDDLDTVLKAMYRVQGEAARIRVADAFGRQHYDVLGLGDGFGAAINAMHQCRKYRNQYSHCIWYDDLSGRLAFTNLEQIADETTILKDLKSLPIFHVDSALLEGQERYFMYTEQLVLWINFEGRTRARKIKLQPFEKPLHLEAPKRYLEE